jgi:hypothetical protein
MATGTPPVPLNAATVHRLPPGVRVPAYDRHALKQGIVHVGVGGFHRAHQAVYLDNLLHRPGGEAYGVCGVGLLPPDTRMRDVLRAQDHLYTVVTRGGGDQARVIGSIADYLYAPDDPEVVVERMASPATRIVSLTVTEAGYCLNQATGELDVDHPAVVHDLRNPHRPRGTFGYPYLCGTLRSEGVAGLRVRFRSPNELEECVLDALAGISFLQADHVTSVAVVGHSFGGAVAIQAAALSPDVRTCVALSSQTHGAGPAASLGPRCSLLLAHGLDDEILPPDCSRQIYRTAREPKRLALKEHVRHGLDEWADELPGLIHQWMIEQWVRPESSALP